MNLTTLNLSLTAHFKVTYHLYYLLLMEPPGVLSISFSTRGILKPTKFYNAMH